MQPRINQLTREDFQALDARRVLVFTKTKEEIAKEDIRRISEKEKRCSVILEERGVSNCKETTDVNGRYDIWIKYMSIDRPWYKQILGDDKCQAHLEQKAREFAERDDRYEFFLDFVIQYDLTIIDFLAS